VPDNFARSIQISVFWTDIYKSPECQISCGSRADTYKRKDGRTDGRTTVTKVTGHFLYYAQTLVEDQSVRECMLVQVSTCVCVCDRVSVCVCVCVCVCV